MTRDDMLIELEQKNDLLFVYASRAVKETSHVKYCEEQLESARNTLNKLNERGRVLAKDIKNLEKELKL